MIEQTLSYLIAKNDHDQWGALTLRNPFYNKLDALAKNKTVVDPMATNKYSTANRIHAMYSLRLQEDICQIFVHRMQHNNKVPSEMKLEKNEEKNKYVFGFRIVNSAVLNA